MLSFIDDISDKLGSPWVYPEKHRFLKKSWLFFLSFSNSSCYIDLNEIRIFHSTLCPLTLGETDMALSVQVSRGNVGKIFGCLSQNLGKGPFPHLNYANIYEILVLALGHCSVLWK